MKEMKKIKLKRTRRRGIVWLPSLLAITFSLSLLACGKEKKGEKEEGLAAEATAFTSASINALQGWPGLDEGKEQIRPELKDIFCVHVYKLPLKANFDQELSVLCENNKPTASFAQLDKLGEVVGSQPRAAMLKIEQQGEFTKGIFATVYRVPIQPKWVRSAKIQEYMVGSSVYDYVQLKGEVKQSFTEELGGDLQFGKWHLNYKTDVQTPDVTKFSNERTTELNSFQVHGGNPDIGIGAEHLIDAPAGDYRAYNTTTITIANQDGGSSLITIIRVEVRNNGYAELSEKVINDISTAQATHVHHGLMEEKAAGHFP